MPTSTQDEDIFLKIETSIIDADLNSVILYTFLMGMYTIVFVWTMHLYTNRQKQKRSNIVTATLVALYLVNVANFGIQWLAIKQAIVDKGETRTSIFIALQYWSAGVIDETSSVLQFIGYILADGLLIWRCYNIANRSIRAIVIPGLLYFCVIAFSIISAVFFGLFSLNPAALPVLSTRALDIIAGGSIACIVDAACSLSATFVIYCKISNSLEAEMANKGRYQRIIRIAIESAALYSIAGLVLSILSLVNSCTTNEDTILSTAAAINYVLSFDFTFTGLAPTIMVAQICLSSLEPAETTAPTSILPISALNFHHQQTAYSTIRVTREGQ